MPIPYALFENNLTSDPDDYLALVQSTGAADLETVIERMMERGSTITRADVLGVLEDFFAAIETLTLEGQTVSTPIAQFGVSIKGVFTGQTDSFDPARHSVRPLAHPGSRLRAAIAQRAQPAKQESVRPAPNLVDFIDLGTGERNSALTPNSMGQIVGHRLKVDMGDPNQGVFFIGEDGNETRVTVMGRNKPGDLLFMVPALPAGEYVVEVRALFGSEVRSGRLAASLTVA